jgi:rhodanese-related sulfurtransferase
MKKLIIVGLLVIALMTLSLFGACSTESEASEPADSTPDSQASEPADSTPDATVSDFEIIRAAADAWVSSGNPPNISAQDLYDLVSDGNTYNDPFILSVRAGDIYVEGHIPAAINIYWTEVFKPENLALLPTDKQIVVYSYTGQTGGQVTALLNALGYDAINLKWGMTSWTLDDEIAPGRYDPTKDCLDAILATGGEPGDITGEHSECGVY